MALDDAWATERVRAALRAHGFDAQIIVADDTTHTAADAAAVAGCALGQIIKTLVAYVRNEPHLVLVAGDRRLDDRALAARFAVGRKQIRLANGDEVMALTGYPPGGVSPFGMPGAVPVLLDQSLRRFDTVWLAAGTANTIFPMPLAALERILGGEFAEISVKAT